MIFKPEGNQASWDYLTNLKEAVILKSSVEYIKNSKFSCLVICTSNYTKK